MSAGGKIGNDDDRVTRRGRRRVVAIAEHAPGFGNVEMSTPERQAVRTIELADDRRPGARRHDAALRGERDEQGSRGVDGQGSWRAQTSGEDFDANPGWHRKVRGLSAGHGRGPQRRRGQEEDRHSRARAVRYS